MVEYNLNLDTVFYSLADPTRRDILQRVSKEELSISKIAKPYSMSFAAIAKHVNVLETANLITKRKIGKEQLVCASPGVIKEAMLHLEAYEKVWSDRFNALDTVLQDHN